MASENQSDLAALLVSNAQLQAQNDALQSQISALVKGEQDSRSADILRQMLSRETQRALTDTPAKDALPAPSTDGHTSDSTDKSHDEDHEAPAPVDDDAIHGATIADIMHRRMRAVITNQAAEIMLLRAALRRKQRGHGGLAVAMTSQSEAPEESCQSAGSAVQQASEASDTDESLAGAGPSRSNTSPSRAGLTAVAVESPSGQHAKFSELSDENDGGLRLHRTNTDRMMPALPASPVSTRSSTTAPRGMRMRGVDHNNRAVMDMLQRIDARLAAVELSGTPLRYRDDVNIRPPLAQFPGGQEDTIEVSLDLVQRLLDGARDGIHELKNRGVDESDITVMSLTSLCTELAILVPEALPTDHSGRHFAVTQAPRTPQPSPSSGAKPGKLIPTTISPPTRRAEYPLPSA